MNTLEKTRPLAAIKTLKFQDAAIRHHDLLKDFSNDKLGTEFLDKYVSDKLIDEIYLFGEVKIKSDY